MKIFLVLATVLICAAAADDYSDTVEWIDYRLVSNYDDTTNPSTVNCVVPGLVCGGCKDIYLCTNTTGEWDASWLGSCDGTQTCDAGKCTATPNSECAIAGKEFKCESLEGMYPDPGLCTKFSYCVPDGSGKIQTHPSSCGANSKYGYNIRTTYCDVPLVNNKCGVSNIPICKTPGQTAALKENPTMYYVCKAYASGSSELYPFLYTCPNGRSYNGNYGCNAK